MKAGQRTDLPINGISVARALVTHYQQSVRDALLHSGVSANQADRILKDDSFHSGGSLGPLTHETWFTLRRSFALSDYTLAELARTLRLRQAVVDAFARLPRLYQHQEAAIRAIYDGHCTVLATGTGSGKTEAFLIPLIERCLRHGGPGVKAIIVYPLNALAEDQQQRIASYLQKTGLRVERYTGEEESAQRQQRDRMLHNPPDILITNHVMLERILTQARTKSLRGIGTLQTVVFDEVHTFRGNVGADVSWLIRRLRAACGTNPVFVGASATLRSYGGYLADELGEPQPGLHSFLRDLFVPPDDDVRLIRPSYIDEPLDGGSFPEPRWAELRWPRSVTDTPAVSAAFLGLDPEVKADHTWDFGFNSLQDDAGRFSHDHALREHALIRSWRKFLIERGAATYAELVDEARATYEHHHSRLCPDPEALAAGALAAIAETNAAAAREQRERREAAPVLNLVTHLVLTKAQGWLSLCLVCGRYALGAEEACTRCGSVLFDVMHEDATAVVAEVDWAQRRFTPVRRDRAWPRLTAAVSRLQPMDAPLPDAERVELVDSASTCESLAFSASPAGTLQIRPYAAPVGSRPQDVFVRVSEAPDGLDHLASIADKTLSLSGHAPRLLAFGDDRTSVSVVGYVLREHLADRYLRDLVGRRVNHEPIRLDQVWSEARQGLADGAETTYYKELEANLEHWFVRLCATPCRSFPSHRGMLVPSDTDLLASLGPLAEFLVDTCITEGAVAWYQLVKRPAYQTRRLFEFDHRRRTSRRVLSFDSGSRPASADVQSIALTGDASSIYGAEVLQFGASALEAAAQALVECGVFVRVEDVLQGGSVAYALAPSAAMLARWPAVERLGGYRAVGIHTSETPRGERTRIERDFGEPATPLSIIVATSTLEMGVDIGALRNVLCLGIPPTPANYAQRVGRAGRSPNGWYALSLIWCDDSHPHHQFFLHDRTEMRYLLSGQVSQPEMDIDNPRVVRRHLFAAVLQDRLSDRTALIDLVSDPLSGLQDLPTYLREQFEHRLSVRDVLLHELAPILKHLEAERSRGRGRGGEAWFASPDAPSYGFRRDELSLYLSEEDEANNRGPVGHRREEISRRPPEQAVRFWAPGRPVATPRGLMRVQYGVPQGPKTFQFPDADQPSMAVAQYAGFLVSREEGWVSRRDLVPTSLLLSRLHADAREVGSGDDIAWLAWRAVSGAHLSVVNPGRDGWTRSEQERPPDPWGFHTPCDALVVMYDPLVLGTVGEASLASALDHAVQRYMRINDAELLLLPGIDCSLAEPGFQTLVLADVAGHGLVPVERLARHFREILRQALGQLRQCDCRNGCFRCLRTYSTVRLAIQTTKTDTERLLAAILGEGSWSPPLPPNPLEQRWRGVESLVEVHLRGDRVTWSIAEQQGIEMVRNGEKSALVQALMLALDHVPSDASVVVRTNREYFADMIRGVRKARLDQDESRVIFRSFRFPRFRAEFISGRR